MSSIKPLLLTEIQGIYGPVFVTERVLQKIWWRGDFHQGDLRTLTGKILQRIEAGRWNMHEGPDFIGASLKVDGEIIRGDVEVHFYANDWHAHGHDCDGTFDNVVLHVLLFPPRENLPLKTRSGHTPEVLVLLPHLKEDIEDYANQEALLSLETREKSSWVETLLPFSAGERLRLLREKSAARWIQKVRFAKQRIALHGWDDACHQMMLETLGLKRNRAPMSALAQRHRLVEMAGCDAQSLFDEERAHWKLATLRPANHPRLRLEQYLKVLGRPNWPERLLRWGKSLPSGNSTSPDTVGEFRRARKFSSMLLQLSEEVLSHAVSGTRLNTLAIDAFLPLLAACEIQAAACADFWQHWQLGDIPNNLAKHLRPLLPLENNRPPIIDNGLFQGLLQLGHERC